MEYNKKEILEIYENEKNKTYVAQAYCSNNNLEYSDTVRRSVSKIINSEVVDEDLENFTKTDTQGYKSELSNMPSAWCAEKSRFYSIEEYCDTYGLDKNSVKSSKLVSHNQSHMVYNIAFFTDDEEAILDVDNHLEEIIAKYIHPIKSTTVKDTSLSSDWFDRLVFTDVHIAMDVKGNGDPLYEGKWDREEVLLRLDLMIQHTKNYQKSDLLVISNLGDYLDGLGGKTTRKGHDLPQNMNDKDAFDLGIEFSLKLIDSLVDNYETIQYNFLVEDNHSGVFGFFVSQAIKGILEERYPNKVTVKTQRKFIDHFKVGKHTIVETHGKDSESLKFGFRPQLDDKQAKKIDHYCKENLLYDGNYIEFAKGDSHISLFDDSSNTDFQYYNYPAFSPPSNWVKTSFSNSPSGFRFFNIHREKNIKNHFPFWF